MTQSLTVEETQDIATERDVLLTYNSRVKHHFSFVTKIKHHSLTWYEKERKIKHHFLKVVISLFKVEEKTGTNPFAMNV